MSNGVQAFRSKVFDTFCGFDRALCPRGHVALSPAWRAALRKWLVDGQARTWIVRKGRRIGASTVIAPRLTAAWILAVAPTLRLPPGEFVTIGFLSIKRGESDNRLSQVAAVFDAVGIRYELRPSAGEIALLDLPVKVKVLTRNWRSIVGETIGLLWCDEVSRWESGDDFSNPAEAVVTSLMPSVMTIPASLVAMVSSPWGLTDYHAQRFEMGDTPAQCTAFLPTFVANPTLSEAMLRAETPNEAVFLREYAAIPSATLERVFFAPESIVAARARKIPSWFHKRGAAAICFDASAGHTGGDSFGWMILQWYEENPLETYVVIRADNANGIEVRISPRTKKPIRRLDRPQMDPILRVEFCDKLDAPFHDSWAPSRIAKRIAADGARYCARDAHGDQWSEHSYQEHLKNQGIRMFYHPLTATTKPMACLMLRQWFDAGVIAIADSPAADALCKELSVFQETMTSGGTMRYSAPSGQEHDDLIGCLLQASLSSQCENTRERIGGKPARGLVTSSSREQIIFQT
jgi:hypothetical protein